MELKHKDCFIGSLIRIFDLAPITHEIHVVWNYVNIFSINRGTNRFKALLITFNYLREMDIVKSLNVKIPSLKILKKWINKTENWVESTVNVVLIKMANPQQNKPQSVGHLVPNLSEIFPLNGLVNVIIIGIGDDKTAAVNADKSIT